MEIIVHGKPGSRSSQMTSGLDAILGNRIVDGFFNSMGSINEAEFLVVDAVYWNNDWYSIYTFELCKGIKDIADRPSYFALSIILQNKYYCLVSEVYEKLKKVCSNYVVGNYIAAEGKYLIPDFGDELLFDGLLKEISRDYTNMLEDFDCGFKPLQGPRTNIFYNPVDCDAKAFVQSLRVNGRVIVCEKAYTKDYLLGNVDKIKSKLIQAQNSLQIKDTEIVRLNKELTDIKTTLNTTGKQNNKRLRELESGTITLKNENETLKTLNQSYESTINKYRSKLTEIANITRTVEKEKGSQPEKLQSGMKPSAFGNKRKLLVMSFAIILFLFLLMSSCLRTCSNENIDYYDKEENANIDMVVSDTVAIDTRESEIDNQDMDCGLSIMNVDTNTPLIDGSYIAKGSTILVTISKNVGSKYGIHTDNLKDSNKIKFNENFKVFPKDINKPIIISYRSDDINKTNQKNKITLYINK